ASRDLRRRRRARGRSDRVSDLRSAVIVPVPEAAAAVDDWRERTCEAKPSTGVPPHVTLLVPFVAAAEITNHVIAELHDVLGVPARAARARPLPRAALPPPGAGGAVRAPRGGARPPLPGLPAVWRSVAARDPAPDGRPGRRRAARPCRGRGRVRLTAQSRDPR